MRMSYQESETPIGHCPLHREKEDISGFGSESKVPVDASVEPANNQNI